MNSQTVHIQYVGDVKGTLASELKVGDRLVWNGGSTSTITSIEIRGKSVYTKQLCSDGKVYDRRFLKTRLVARI